MGQMLFALLKCANSIAHCHQPRLLHPAFNNLLIKADVITLDSYLPGVHLHGDTIQKVDHAFQLLLVLVSSESISIILPM